MDTEEIRAFLALPLAVFDEDIRRLLNKLKIKYPGVKWVNPSQIHTTLHFFGAIDSAKFSVIHDCITPITQQTKPIQLSLKGIGGFPNLERPRVIWTGIHGEIEKLSILQLSVEKDLKYAGFECEQRPFKPHLTLGRIKDGKRIALIVPLDFQSSSPKVISEIILYRSRLTPEGPLYEKIHTFTLSQT